MLMTELLKIKERVEKAEGSRAQNLASAINPETLTAAHRRMDGRKAVGVDGIGKETYGSQLEKNVEELVTLMKRESHQPQPSRRVYIDKPGSKKKRPLGISAYEDKLHIIIKTAAERLVFEIIS